MKKERVIPLTNQFDNQFGYLGDGSNPRYLIDKPNVLNIFPILGDPDFLIREALARDLSDVKKIRFDPVNVCNLECVFCTSDLTQRRAQISVDAYNRLLRETSTSLSRVTVGCGYEPLMAKNIEEYFIILRSLKEASQEKALIINLVSNGTLIGERNFGEFADVLDWVHISMHSNRREVFERIEKRGNFDTLVSNIKLVKRLYPQLNLHIEIVVNKLNFDHIGEFVDWAFDDLSVDSINLKRVAVDAFHKSSYLAKNLGLDLELHLTDIEWDVVRLGALRRQGAKERKYSAFCSEEQFFTRAATTDVIEL